MLDRFDANEFAVVEYMATSGGLGTEDSDARMTYYGNNALPHVLFNGGGMLVGAGTDVIDGGVYDPIVRGLLDDPTPLKMQISSHSFSPQGGSVTVDLELEGDLADISQMRLRVAILEDDLSYGGTVYNHVLRDLLEDVALTIDQVGQTQQVTIPFTMDGAWNPDNLHLIAFVQDDGTREILQSANSRPTPDYSLRYYASGDRTVVGEGSVVFGETGLFNMGNLDDTYDISLDVSNLPAGWSAHFTHEGSDHTSLALPLAAGERALLNLAIETAGSGEGEVTLIFHSQSGAVEDRALTFKVITPDIRILLVDDDGAYEYESLYFGPAIEAAGRGFATWNRNDAAVSATVLADFDLVIWECGWAFPTVDAADRAALATYLDGGGNLFITGQDIGWEMYDEGGAAVAWYNSYLHATYVSDDTNLLNLDGVAGDPITDGLSLRITGGDGANNQDYPSDIDPRGAGASTILTYDATRNGGIKADTGVHKVVYLAFGFEAIDNAADRAALMSGIIGWMLPGEAGAGETPFAGRVLRGNSPNPFNPRTEIEVSLPAAADVTLAIYDVKGRRVRTLQSGMLPAGVSRHVWDGADDAGRTQPSGTYFCRVSGAVGDEAVKMSLVR